MMGRNRFFSVFLGLIIVAAGAGGYYYLASRPPARPTGSVESERGTISVFFPDAGGRLAKKTVEVQKQLPDRARADILFRELKEARSIPDRLRLYELAEGENGVLYLNVSKEFLDPESPAREVSMVYAIVNSYVASFPHVERVQVLVEGQPVYTRSGLLYIFEPLRPSKELLED
jgi:hypothetical protein